MTYDIEVETADVANEIAAAVSSSDTITALEDQIEEDIPSSTISVTESSATVTVFGDGNKNKGTDVLAPVLISMITLVLIILAIYWYCKWSDAKVRKEVMSVENTDLGPTTHGDVQITTTPGEITTSPEQITTALGESTHVHEGEPEPNITVIRLDQHQETDTEVERKVMCVENTNLVKTTPVDTQVTNTPEQIPTTHEETTDVYNDQGMNETEVTIGRLDQDLKTVESIPNELPVKSKRTSSIQLKDIDI